MVYPNDDDDQGLTATVVHMVGGVHKWEPPSVLHKNMYGISPKKKVIKILNEKSNLKQSMENMVFEMNLSYLK